MTRSLISALLVVSAVGCTQPLSSEATVGARDERLVGATREDVNGWIVLHLHGAPATEGFQYGWLAANEIDDAVSMFRQYSPTATKREWSFYRGTASDLFWPKLGADERDEIDGIVAGARARGKSLDRADLVALNGWIEIAWYLIPQLDQQANKAPGNCSAFIATGEWTRDGGIVMGHNAWVDYCIGERWNLVLDIVPARGHRMIMDSLPGFIDSGDDFALNDAGIMVTETTISGFQGFDRNGVPEFARARRAVQHASSIDDWVRLMSEGNNGAYANSWLIGDRKSGEIARLELGLTNRVLERTTNGCFVGSNFPANDTLRAQETTFKADDANNCPNVRRCRWDALMREWKGRIDVDAGKRFLADHVDPRTGETKPSGRTLCGHLDVDATGAEEWGWPPFFPGGASTSKVTDSKLAARLAFDGFAGHSCGQPFLAAPFLSAHPDFAWQRSFLRDMPAGAWTRFESGRVTTSATGQ